MRLLWLLAVMVVTVAGSCIDPETIQSCNGQGSCQNGDGDFCQCYAGFHGTYCELTTCRSSPQSLDCSGIGVCGGSNTCACDGRTQPYCADPTCIVQTAGSIYGDLEGTTCGGHGACTNAACACDDGYAGAWCVFPTCNTPGSTTCFNHGTCSSGHCTCSPGYPMPVCETFDCITNTATFEHCSGSNVGECGGVPGNKFCSCYYGHIGTACETRTCVNPLDVSAPCRGVSDAVCTSGVCMSCGASHCGSTCERACGCSTNPLHSAGCRCNSNYPYPDIYSSTTCLCKPGYELPYCCPVTSGGATCSGQACLPSGTCQCLPNSCSGFGRCSTVDGSCACNATAFVDPFQRCCPYAVSADGNSKTCAGRGMCSDIGCICDEGYEDTYCCPVGCSAHGTCTRLGCQCQDGWFGGACEDNINCPDGIGGLQCSGSPRGACGTESAPDCSCFGALGCPVWMLDVHDLGFRLWNFDSISYHQEDISLTLAGVVFKNGTGMELMWIFAARAIWGYDPRTRLDIFNLAAWRDIRYPRGDCSIPSAPLATWPLLTLATFVSHPEYEAAIIRNRNNVVGWAYNALAVSNPFINNPDAAYMHNAAVDMNATRNSQDWIARRIAGVVNVISYAIRIDWAAHVLRPVQSTAPTRCQCGVVAAQIPQHIITGRACQSDCPQTNQFIYGGVQCTGYHQGEWHGGCNYDTSACVCDPRWTGPACDVRINETCISGNSTFPVVCSNHGTCDPPETSCVCDGVNSGPHCEHWICSENLPTEQQRTTQCNSMGLCGLDTVCTCNVGAQLLTRDTTADPPFLPVGSNCDINGVAWCGTYTLLSSFSQRVTWTECSGNGVCIDGSPHPACSCFEPFSGPHCNISACNPECNTNQACNLADGTCACKELYTGSECTEHLCAHGAPNTAGTACVCSQYWKLDSSGNCTIPQCPLLTIGDLGERVCNSTSTIDFPCTTNLDPHTGKCCVDKCGSKCTFAGSTNGVPKCPCDAIIFKSSENQTDGICHSVCNGQGYIVVGNSVQCTCNTHYYLERPWNATIDIMDTQCLRSSCRNGTATSGTRCVCRSGWTGRLCDQQLPSSPSSSSTGQSSSASAHSSGPSSVSSSASTVSSGSSTSTHSSSSSTASPSSSTSASSAASSSSGHSTLSSSTASTHSSRSSSGVPSTVSTHSSSGAGNNTTAVNPFGDTTTLTTVQLVGIVVGAVAGTGVLVVGGAALATSLTAASTGAAASAATAAAGTTTVTSTATGIQLTEAARLLPLFGGA